MASGQRYPKFSFGIMDSLCADVDLGVTNRVVAFQRIIDNLIERYKLQNTFAYLDNVIVAGMSQEDHDNNLQALLHVAKTEGLPSTKTNRLILVTQLIVLGYRVSQGKI